MHNTMSYKVYLARIDFDVRDNIFVSHVPGIAEWISFHGEAVSKLTTEFHQAIEHYLGN